jgi:pyruvate dehydrogenase E1 component beta subunit
MRTYGERIAHETVEWMKRDPKALVLGVGVKDEKGIFGTTKLANEMFPDRVIETPLSENMLTGALVGLAQNGWHPLFVHARSDFMTLSMEHIVNSIAKWEFMGGEQLQIGIRCIIGKGWGNGPQHTQSTAHWFTGTPGVVTHMPATGVGIQEAIMSIKESPTLIYEHRALYNEPDDMNPTYIASGEGEDMEAPRVLFVTFSHTYELTKLAAHMAWDLRGLPSFVVAQEQLSSLITPKAEMIELAVIVDVGSQLGGSLSAQLARDLDMARVKRFMPRLSGSIVVSPPHVPTPASEFLEEQWYPNILDIANAALYVVGAEPLTMDDVAVMAKKQDVKDGPF